MANLVETIEALMSGQTDKIRQATADFQVAFQKPETVHELVKIILVHESSGLRQYACLLLKKRVEKLRHWATLTPEQQTLLKTVIVQRLFVETDVSVRRSLSTLVGVLVRHESVKDPLWFQNLLNKLNEMCTSADCNVNSTGCLLLRQLLNAAPDQFIDKMHSIGSLILDILTKAQESGSLASVQVANILTGMKSLVPFILGNNFAEVYYHRSIPTVLEALKHLATMEDDDYFTDSFELLDIIAEHIPKCFNNHLKDIFNFCFHYAPNQNVKWAVRIPVISFLSTLVLGKKKAILKAKLLEPIVQVAFTILTTEPEMHGNDYFGELDNATPMSAATQLLDTLALNMSSEKLIAILISLLEQALQGNDLLARRGALVAIAVVAEGCAEIIIKKYLNPMLNVVKAALVDSNPVVRGASFFALGQFAEYLQPEIHKYSSDIMQVLFDFWKQLCSNWKSGDAPQQVDRLFYALETLCDSMESEQIAEHLPALMECIFETLETPYPVKFQEFALDILSSTCRSAKKAMTPYFERLIKILQVYLNDDVSSDRLPLRISALETLSCLIRAVGPETFTAFSTCTLEFALRSLAETTEPDQVTVIYNLLAALSTVIGDSEQMTSIMATLIERVKKSILNDSPAIMSLASGDLALPEFVLPGEPNDTNMESSETESDPEEGDKDFFVENSFMDEKEEAIVLLKELACNASKAFLPYVEDLFQTVYTFVDHPHEDIRKVSIEALLAFIIALHKEQCQNYQTALIMYIPKVVKTAKYESNMDVVLPALESLGELMDSLRQDTFPTLELRLKIFECIQDALLGNLTCQVEDDNSADDDFDQSEMELTVTESAINLIPFFGSCLTADMFLDCLEILYPLLKKKLENAISANLESQRACIYGAFADCLKSLKTNLKDHLKEFMALLWTGLNDRHEKCRQNAVFGLGEIVYRGECVPQQVFSEILSSLMKTLSTETDAAVLDNACGAICRLISYNSSWVSLPKVLPLLFNHLPLKEDFAEYTPVLEALQNMLKTIPQYFTGHIEQIALILLFALKDKQLPTPECESIAADILLHINIFYPQSLVKIFSENADLQPIFSQHVTM